MSVKDAAIEQLDFPKDAKFTFADSPGEHDPCFIVMPGGCALPVNHHNTPGVDIARAKFIIDACNAALDGASIVDRRAIVERIEKLKSVAKPEDDPHGCTPTWNAALDKAIEAVLRS